MGNYRAAAEEGNFFLRGFNYLFIMQGHRRATTGSRSIGSEADLTPAATEMIDGSTGWSLVIL
jgi:hypothetical protein